MAGWKNFEKIKKSCNYNIQYSQIYNPSLRILHVVNNFSHFVTDSFDP